jgi:hypothetical protein
VPKATWEQSVSPSTSLSWLDEKFVVAAAEAEGVVALLPTVPSPFRNNLLRRRRERELFEHSPGHQEAMEVRLLNKRACNGWYRRRHAGDLGTKGSTSRGAGTTSRRSSRRSSRTRSGRTRLPSTRRMPLRAKTSAAPTGLASPSRLKLRSAPSLFDPQYRRDHRATRTSPRKDGN